MYRQITTAILAATMATGAFAQASTGSHNPAMKDPATHTGTMPAKGRNSFTEAQAQGRIAKAGYANVSKLTKDANGVWQGTATRGGAAVKVGLDYKGNVTVR